MIRAFRHVSGGLAPLGADPIGDALWIDLFDADDDERARASRTWRWFKRKGWL